MATPTGLPGIASYLRIVGRGPKRSRPMSRVEAAEAMAAILAGEALPEQVGALFLVLRHRGETAEEIAGFVDAAKRRLAFRLSRSVDLDWPSYADRHRRQPYFVLSARLVAEAGASVLIHGIAGESQGLAPTRPVIERLGIPNCRDARALDAALGGLGIAYVGLETLCPPLDRLMDLRRILGVRTGVNTMARALNPGEAPAQIVGVFHPPYRALHREAAVLLGQKAAAIFKGGGGEAERNPAKPTLIATVRDGAPGEAEWPALVAERAEAGGEVDLDPDIPLKLWTGARVDPVAEAAVVGTAAIALNVAGRAKTPAEAEALARELWARRNRRALAA
jgi:anthranilate phosphoribosyltransferase